MFIISPKQIRAARELLMWSQKDLACAADVSTNTVLKAEVEFDLKSNTNRKTGTKPKQIEFVSNDTLMKIRNAFEARDVEFTGTAGTNLREESPARAYSGPDSPDIFYEHLLAASKKKGGEILIYCESAAMIINIFGSQNLNDLTRLEEIGKYATVKCLLLDDEGSALIKPFFDVRCTTQFPFSYQARFICDEFHATIETVDSGCFAFYELWSKNAVLGGQMDFSASWASARPFFKAGNVKRVQA